MAARIQCKPGKIKQFHLFMLEVELITWKIPAFRFENRISMSSINTNPFDDDYDEQSIVSASTSTTHISRTKKKKRQAPLPPQVSQKPQKNEVEVEVDVKKCFNDFLSLFSTFSPTRPNATSLHFLSSDEGC